MKTFLFTTVFVFLTGLSVFSPNAAHAQSRWGFVDPERILKADPDYISAQKQVEALSNMWLKESESRQIEIDKLSREYRAQSPLLTDEMRKRSENEIVLKENELKNFQSAKFGFGGELSQMRDKLIQPIQERVSKAIEAVRVSSNLDVIWDKSVIQAVDPRYDKTNDVIKRMGLTPLDDK